MEPIYKRRQFLIDKDFQLRFMGRIFIMILCASALTLAVLFGSGLVGMELFSPVALVALVAPAVLMLGYSLALSHRLAGPVFRVRKILKEMSQGDLRGAIAPLRRKDELKLVLEDIRGLRENLRGDMLELRSLVNYLDYDGSHHCHEHLKRMEEILQRYQVR